MGHLKFLNAFLHELEALKTRLKVSEPSRII